MDPKGCHVSAAPVAICGIGIRLPGDIDTPTALFEALRSGRDVRSPPDVPRYNANAVFNNVSSHATKLRKLTTETMEGYWLRNDDITGRRFDPALFSISPGDSAAMDPQQRLLLQVAWEALQGAGEQEHSWRGARVGCFVGSFGGDWEELQAREPLSAAFLAHAQRRARLPGCGSYAQANRVSHALDLRGPSVTVKTACSAGGVALHLACQAIRSGECDSALVMGVNVILSPAFTGLMAEQGVLAPDGSCKTFDAAADGYARAEAANCLFIKRIDWALRDGNPVRAVIRGSAVNSDGRTAGLATPSSAAQEAVIRDAYRCFGVEDGEIRRTAMVECHGTGTAVGDAVEANAIASVFGDEGLLIGSVKPNVGHSEGAAAITSIIKATLCLENRIILPNIKFCNPNPRIPFLRGKLTVPVQATEWPADRLERISINAFGIGGTNFHVILDSAESFQAVNQPLPTSLPPKRPLARARPAQLATLLLFSAGTQASLNASVTNVTTYLKNSNSSDLTNLSYTLNHRRSHLSQHRTYLVLDDNHQDASIPRPLSFNPRPLPGGPTFIFPGQGSQHPGMGLHLLKSDPALLADLAAMDAAIKTLLPPHLYKGRAWTLRAELTRPAAASRLLSDPAIAQPALTALQVSLVRRLARHGVRPGAVVGHSSGEVAAAYAAGVLTMEEAVLVAALRGHFAAEAAEMSGRGGMAAVSGLGRAEVEPLLNDFVVIACENSRKSLTLSGDKEAVAVVVRNIKERFGLDISAGMLRVVVAYHSDQMKPVGASYESALETLIQPRKPNIPFYSSVTGQQHREGTDFAPHYWRRNLESPVIFSSAVSRLLSDAANGNVVSAAAASVHLEIGPQATLAGPLRQIYADAGPAPPAYVPLQGVSDNSAVSFAAAVGELHCRGVQVDLPVPEGARVLPDLPPYPWQPAAAETKPTGEDSWPLPLSGSRAVQEFRFPRFPRHELLGSRNPADNAMAGVTWRCLLSLAAVPWLADHRVGGDMVFPAAGYISMAAEVARQLSRTELCYGLDIREMNILNALVLQSSGTVELVTSATREMLTDTDESDWWEVSIYSVKPHGGSGIPGAEDSWTRHCKCRVKAWPLSETSLPTTAKAVETSLLIRHADPGLWYKSLRRVGHDYGPAFRHVRMVRASVESPATTLAEVSIEQRRDDGDVGTDPEQPFGFWHPSIIDQLLQSLIIAAHFGQPQFLEGLHLPTRFDRILLDISDIVTVQSTTPASPKDNLSVQTVITSNTAHKVSGDCIASTIRDGLPSPTFWIKGMHFKRVPDSSGRTTFTHSLVQPVWKPHIDLAASSALSLSRAGTATSSEFSQTHAQLEELFALCAAAVRVAVPASFPAPGHLAAHLAWLHGADNSTVASGADAAGLAIQAALARLEGSPASAAAALLGRCREHAAALFSGEAQPLELFLNGGLLSQLYDWMNSLWSYQEFLGLVSHLRGRRLRVLEVGAGTGGLTACILDGLRSADGEVVLERYTYTDVSAGFFQRARERFVGVGSPVDGVMEYRVLDISRHPREQGFVEDEAYDLVIASNVLHATPYLTETLRHVKYLLKPDGRLLVQELACETKWINFIMGFLPGWWLGTNDGRNTQPYLASSSQWTERLDAAGFARPEAFVYDAECPLQLNASFVVRPAASRCPLRNVTILSKTAGKDNGIVSHLEDCLLRRGHFVQRGTFVPNGLPANIHEGDVISVVDVECHGDEPFLFDMSDEKLGSLKALVQSLGSATQTQSNILWLIRPCQFGQSHDPRHAAILGAARTIRAETGLRFATMEVDNVDADVVTTICNVLLRLNPISSPDKENNLDFDMEFSHSAKWGGVLVPRLQWTELGKSLVDARQPTTEGFRLVNTLQTTRTRSMDNLAWVQMLCPPVPSPGHVRIKVQAAGLNFKDVVTATGILDNITPGTRLGLEAAGNIIVTHPDVAAFSTGDRVLVFAPDAGCLSTEIDVPVELCAHIPPDLDYPAAAGMPCIFITALRALVDRARLQPGQTVLVHSAAGGLGLAAIQVARHLGAGRILVTVGTTDKIAFLTEFCGVSPQDVVGSSRDDGFVEGVAAATAGRGVDVVLNTLAGELLHASWRCLAPGGMFVELGKRDTLGRGRLAMDPFDDNRSFVGVEMANLARQDPAAVARLLGEMMRLYKEGEIRPVEPLATFSWTSAAKAVRQLSLGKHVGKMVVECDDSVGAATTTGGDLMPCASQPFKLRPDAVYLIMSSPSGLAPALAQKLVSMGAKIIVFASRSAAKPNPQYDLALAELRGMGCQVLTYTCNVTDQSAVTDLLSFIDNVTGGKPIAGALHTSMVLSDAPLVDMNAEQWRAATDPKIRGAWNLHQAFSTQPLDFFVLFGSTSGLCGQPEQANYAAGNTFLAGLCRHRRARGLPCSVLDLGPVEDVGYVAARQGLAERLERQGTRLVPLRDILAAVEIAIAGSRVDIVGCDQQQDGHFAVGLGCVVPLDDPTNTVSWVRDPRMAFYRHASELSSAQGTPLGAGGGGSRNASSTRIAEHISRLNSGGEASLDSPSAARLLGIEIARAVLGLVGGDRTNGSEGKEDDDTILLLSPASQGLDSLILAEVRGWWRRVLGTEVGALQLTSAASFGQLGQIAVSQLMDRRGKSPTQVK